MFRGHVSQYFSKSYFYDSNAELFWKKKEGKQGTWYFSGHKLNYIILKKKILIQLKWNYQTIIMSILFLPLFILYRQENIHFNTTIYSEASKNYNP